MYIKSKVLKNWLLLLYFFGQFWDLIFVPWGQNVQATQFSDTEKSIIMLPHTRARISNMSVTPAGICKNTFVMEWNINRCYRAKYDKCTNVTWLMWWYLEAWQTLLVCVGVLQCGWASILKILNLHTQQCQWPDMINRLLNDNCYDFFCRQMDWQGNG